MTGRVSARWARFAAKAGQLCLRGFPNAIAPGFGRILPQQLRPIGGCLTAMNSSFMALAGPVCGSGGDYSGAHVKMDENGKRFLLEKAEECRRRAERAPTENVRKLSLKMAEQLAWYARPEMAPPPPMYTIRAELEHGGVSLKGAATAAEALECLETMTGRNIEIAGPLGETLTKSELLVHLSREARASRETATVTVLRTAVA